MQLKKIAVIHPTFGYNGGAENVILASAKGFKELEIETDVYTYKLRKDAPNYIKQFKTDITLNPLIFNKTAKYLAKVLSRYDAVIIHNFPAAIFYGLAHKEAKKNNTKLPKSFWYCHEPSVRLYGCDDESYIKLQRTWDIAARLTMRLDRFGVDKINYITANSLRTKNAVKRVYGRDSEIIYPCISRNGEIMPIKESKHFVYIGRVEKPKNLQNAAKAFKELLKKIDDKDLKFIIAGRGRYEKELKKLVNGIGMKNNIIFKGYVSEEEKNRLLNESYALVMPSINEPFGLTAIEALYSSCISLISELSGVYEVIKNCSVSCDMAKVDSISKSMLKIYKNGGIKRELIESSKDILDNFTASKYVSNILDYIKKNL